MIVAIGAAVLVALHGTARRTAASPPPHGDHASGAAAGGADGVAVDPSLFTTGSCEAFAPTSGDRHETVFIDAGHGGRDPGAIGVTASGRTIHEAAETLPVELATMALLRADGFRVVVSRTRQTEVARPQQGDISGAVFTPQGEIHEIAARDVCADRANADLLLAIYFDAGGSEENAGSVTAYDRPRPFWRSNLRFAQLLQRDVLAAMNAQGWQIPNDGVVSDVSLGGPPLTSGGAAYGHLMVIGPAMRGFFTTPSTMPGALIEPLFITDPYEGSIAASAKGQHVIAEGLATAVEQYFAGDSA